MYNIILFVLFLLLNSVFIRNFSKSCFLVFYLNTKCILIIYEPLARNKQLFNGALTGLSYVVPIVFRSHIFAKPFISHACFIFVFSIFFYLFYFYFLSLFFCLLLNNEIHGKYFTCEDCRAFFAIFFFLKFQHNFIHISFFSFVFIFYLRLRA